LIGAEEFLLLISATLFLCYISGLIYTRTRIPDILILLGFGVLLGPVLGIFQKDTFVAISPLMSVVAICIITFESGISLDVKTFRKALFKSFTLAILTFFTVMLTVGFVVHFAMPETFSLREGMLLGTMVAGISTMAVTSLLDGLQKLIPKLESTRAILTLESTLCDPIRVVAAITLIRMLMTPGFSLQSSAKDIVFTFVIGILVGLVFSLLWSEVLDRLRGRPLNYMMTMAVLFPPYIVGEMAGNGGGTMASFIFGLVLANYKNVAKWLGMNKNLKPDYGKIMEFNEEIAFLLKSYYFVYIGLIVSISYQYLTVGFAVVALLLVIRYIVASLTGRLMGFTREEKVISRLVFTLGTSTLVMSQIPQIYDPTREFILNPSIYPDLCFPIVLGTVLFAALISPVIAKNQLR
jgi:cell volume regulation protein A